MTSKARILLAQEPSVIATSIDALSCYNVIPVCTLAQACHHIAEDGIDLFVIGIHFDDSNALELVRYIRDSSHHADTPIIVIRMLPSPIAKTLRQSVEAVEKFYRITAYLELEQSIDPAWGLREAIRTAFAKSSKNEKQWLQDSAKLTDGSHGRSMQRQDVW